MAGGKKQSTTGFIHFHFYDSSHISGVSSLVIIYIYHISVHYIAIHIVPEPDSRILGFPGLKANHLQALCDVLSCVMLKQYCMTWGYFTHIFRA